MTNTWELYNTPDGTGKYEDKTVGKYATPNYDRDRINIRSMATIKGSIDTLNNTTMDALEKLIPGLSFDYGETNSAFGLYHSADEVIFPAGTNQIIGVLVRRQNCSKNGATECGSFYTDRLCFIDCRNGVRIKNDEGNHSSCDYPCFDSWSDINIYVFSYANIEDCIVEDNVCSALDVYCDCTSWKDVGCIDSKTKKYVRTCNPAGCLAEEDLRTDTICNCDEHYTDIDMGCVRDGVRKYKRVWYTGYEYCAPPSGIEYYEVIDTSCEEPAAQCSVSYPGLCTTQVMCEGAGLYWYNNKCNTTPQAVCSYARPDLCKTQIDCENAGLYWYNGACHTTPQAVCAYNTPENCKTKTECENVDRYWYNNKCNKKPLVEENWFMQETLIPGVQNYIPVAVGIAVPIIIIGAYLVLRKPSKRKK